MTSLCFLGATHSLFFPMGAAVKGKARRAGTLALSVECKQETRARLALLGEHTVDEGPQLLFHRSVN